MARPKKAKVVVPVDVAQPAASTVASTTDVEEVGASPVEEQGAGTHEDPLEATYKELLKEAAAVTKKARATAQEAALAVRKADSALTRAKRLEEERMKR